LQVSLQNYWGWVNKNLLRMQHLLLISLFILPSLSFAATNSALIDKAILQAKDLHLAEQPAWLNLLHYKYTLLGELQSQVDDAGFFLAAQGAHNAQAELEADIRAFYSYQASAHPRCIFPARFHWLNTKLNMLADLPAMDCGKFNDWKQKFQAEKVTLLFPSMHLQNPASMFGHTFIRFDRADKNHLLSYTLSYAASYDESDPLLVYSWKGVTGGYPGKFYIRAYFETLQEYSDIEQRDIWEYQLNLNKHEIEQLLRHLWEVKGAHFDYFFLRENCSYRLLALLDVARENINMSIDSHPLYAVPVDTVRDVEKAGLIAAHHYRPSTHNKISQMIEQIGESASQAAINLADVSNSRHSLQETINEFSINQQAKILLLADELLNQNTTLSDQQQKLQLDILSMRSRLAVNPEEVSFNFNATPPEQSHQTARWNLSAGERQINEMQDEVFYELGIRPVFHDLLDVSKGFIDGASISILDTQLRWYQKQQKLKLQSLDLFSLKSIQAVNPWASPLSRKISFKLKQRDISFNEQVLEFETQFSMGYGVEMQSIMVYALASTQLEYATELDKNYGLYVGADVGALWAFDTGGFSGQTEINFQPLYQVAGEEGDIQKLNLGLQINLFDDQALRFEYELLDYEMFDVSELKLSYLMYF